jgi:hypothetical protein
MGNIRLRFVEWQVVDHQVADFLVVDPSNCRPLNKNVDVIKCRPWKSWQLGILQLGVRQNNVVPKYSRLDRVGA